MTDEEKISKSVEKNLAKVIEAYIINPEVYDYAYKNCEEYKIFIDSLSNENKEKFNKARAAWKIGQGSEKVREGLMHASTFGLTLGIKKLMNINKKSKEDRLAELISSSDFLDIIKFFNETKLFCEKDKNDQ